MKDCEVVNFREKFSEIRALNKVWLKRQITPLCRVAVLKSLILSKIIHLWIYCQIHPTILLMSCRRQCFSLYGKKRRKKDRIRRKTAVRPIAKGGRGLPGIRHYINALKLIWIRKLKTSDHKWKSSIKPVYPKVLLFEQLRSSLPTGEHNFKFWCHVFKAYKEFGKKNMIRKLRKACCRAYFLQ